MNDTKDVVVVFFIKEKKDTGLASNFLVGVNYKWKKQMNWKNNF